MTQQGRALSKERGGGFVARSWLENDGDAALQMDAAARLKPVKRGIWTYDLAAVRILHLSGKAGVAQAGALCDGGTIAVVAGGRPGIRPLPVA